MLVPNTTYSVMFFWTLLLSLCSFTVLADSKKLIFLAQNSQPKYFFVNGELTGLCVDIYHALEKKLAKRQILVEHPLQFTPIKRIFGLVESGPEYIFCGVSQNEPRKQRFGFSTTALYPVNYVLATHINNIEAPHSFADLEGSSDTIGALYGTSSAKELKQLLGEHRVNDSFTDLDIAMKLLSTPPYRLKYMYYHDIGLNYLVGHSGFPLKVLPVKFTSKQHWLIYNKTLAPEVAQALNNALAELKKEGVLKTILKRYTE